MSVSSDRDEQLMRLWAAGMSQVKLAQKFSISRHRVQVIIDRENKKLGKRSLLELDAFRGEALRKLALAEQTIMWQIRAGSLKGIKTLLDIQKRQANLLGLDAPKQIQVSGAGGQPLLDTEAQKKYLLNIAGDLANAADEPTPDNAADEPEIREDHDPSPPDGPLH